jgi:tRNA-specific 2-thiouridylase
MQVLAALSGGVDSSVAAARAVAAGHHVVGVHLALARDRAATRAGSRGCCTIEDAADARRVADTLDIPFYVWDLSERFVVDVIDDFVAEYAAGRTPNPCVRCNERIKFAALLDKAVALGFDAVATGHYARLTQTECGPQLRRCHDQAKDQSYVLAVVGPNRLRHAMFPLGEVTGKDQVRAEARALGLPVADKPDSHDICFIADGDTRGWLSERVEQRGGDVLDESGRVVGRHDGAAGHTIGQRRGLRLATPAADGRPRYVLAVSVVSNTVTVGPAERLQVARIEATDVVWHSTVSAGDRLRAQVRAHADPVPVVVAGADETRLVVDVEQPLRAVAAGQALVLYRDDLVVAGATVTPAGAP